MEKKLGFGCMRLPMNNGEVDYNEFNKMIDYYMEQGFNYFDTAHGYHSGLSEVAINKCLTSRHSRDEYILAIVMPILTPVKDPGPTLTAK